MAEQFRLTPQQQQALDLSRNTAVTAGAGSGKTGVLVRRYIACLEPGTGLGVRNVLAITFTEKAAAEMKDRVRQQVIDRIAAGTDSAHWRGIIDTLDRAAVSTIHSFCGSLLREHPIEADVDPLFETLDEAESSRLRCQAVDEALQQAGEESHELRPHAIALLRTWPRARTAANVLGLLGSATAVEQWASFYAQADDESIRRRIREVTGDAVRSRSASLFSRETLVRLMQFCCTSRTDKLQAVHAEVADALRAGLATTDPAELANLAQQIAAIQLRGGSARNWDDISGCKEVLKQIREEAKSLNGIMPGEADWAALPVLRALGVLYSRARDIYEDYKGHGRSLDFDDLQRLALRLLEQNKGNIRAALHRRFRAVLVDEFQDTNSLQWQIVNRVVQGSDGLPPPGRLFIVGDPKQSIYGFRDAEIRVFDEVKRACIEPAGHTEMDDNFRSAQAVVDFVNALMPGLMGTTELPWDPPYRELIARRLSDVDGTVTLLLPPLPPDGNADPDAEESAAEHVPEARLVARQIRWFVEQATPVWDHRANRRRPASFGDVAILLRGRTHLDLFEEALRAAGIPFVVGGGFSFYQRQEVLDLINLLRFLLHTSNDLALAAVLRSPLIGLSDDALWRITRARSGSLWEMVQNADAACLGNEAAVLEEARRLLGTWLQRSRRSPVSELLAFACEESGLWGSAAGGDRGPQAIANIEKLLDFARGASDLAALVARLDETIQNNLREAEAPAAAGKADTVTILTIHAAKGLEFPIVCVADTGTDNTPKTRDDVALHRDYGFGIKARPPGEDLTDTAIRKIIRSQAAQEEKAENARLLYVALTRARDHLVIAGTPSRKKTSSWRAAICEAFDIDPDSPQDIPLAAVHTDASRLPVAPPPPQAPLDQFMQTCRRACQKTGDERDARLELLGPVAAAALPRFSPTALQRYLECPYSYFLSRVLGAPSTGALGDELPDPLEHDRPHGLGLVTGTIAHRLFEEISQIPPGTEEQALRRYLKEQEISDPAQQRQIIGSILEMVARFRSSEFGAAVLRADEHYSELKFTVAIGRGVVSGMIDRLYRSGGAWHVLDYKTDRVKRDDVDARAAHYRPQLTMYSLAAGRLLGCEPPQAWLYFTRLALAVRVPVPQETAADFERCIADAIDRILAEDYAPTAACPESCEFLGTEYCGKWEV